AHRGLQRGQPHRRQALHRAVLRARAPRGPPREPAALRRAARAARAHAGAPPRPQPRVLRPAGRHGQVRRRPRLLPEARPDRPPDYDASLFFTPTPVPTATPTPAPAPRASGRSDLGAQYIEVDLSQQHLYAWQNGEVVFDIAISSGRPGYDTPTGTFYVNQML